MESKIIKNKKEFGKEYDKLREKLLLKYMFKKDELDVLKTAITMYQKVSNEWIEVTTVKSDMIGMFKNYREDNKEYKLKSTI